MRQPNPISLAPIAVALLLLLAACSGSTGGVSSIDCRLVAGSDANSDMASIPFEAGDLELAVAGLRASIVVDPFGERGSGISIDLHTTPSDGASNSVWLGTSSAGFTNDTERGELVSIVGETPAGAPFGAYCAAS